MRTLIESEMSERIGQLKALGGGRVLSRTPLSFLSMVIPGLLHVAHNAPDLLSEVQHVGNA